MKNFDLRHKVYTLLRKYGYLTTQEIIDYMHIVFDVKCVYHTARKYRTEYEQKYVGLVVEVGPYTPIEACGKRRSYAHNGTSEYKGKYNIPFWHKVTLFFRNWLVQTFNLHNQKDIRMQNV